MRKLAIALLLAGCSDISLEEFADLVAEAAVCEAGDTCVVAVTDSDCLCGAVVNAEDQSEIEDAARRVDCEGAIVDCVVLTNPRCEDDTCVADRE
jgi:hypothetical protein